MLTLELLAHAEGTLVTWCQMFDTAEQYRHLAQFVASANEQNLVRLSEEVMRGTRVA